MGFFRTLPAKSCASHFVLTMLYHVKITPYDPKYVGKGGNPIPEGNSFLIVIRRIDVTYPKEGVVNTNRRPNNPVTRGATIISDVIRLFGADEQTNTSPTLEMAVAEFDRVLPNEV